MSTWRVPLILLVASVSSTIWWYFASPVEREAFFSPGSIAISLWIVYAWSVIDHAIHKRRQPPDST